MSGDLPSHPNKIPPSSTKLHLLSNNYHSHNPLHNFYPLQNTARKGIQGQEETMIFFSLYNLFNEEKQLSKASQKQAELFLTEPSRTKGSSDLC